MKELEGKSNAEKILLLKSLINKQTLKNKQLITKNLKIKTDTEKTLRFIEEAKTIKNTESKPKPPKERDMMSEFKSYISGDAFKRPETKKLEVSGRPKA